MKGKIFLKFIIFILLFLGVRIAYAASPRSNYNLVDELNDTLTKKIITTIRYQDFKSISFSGLNNSSSDFLKAKITYASVMDSILILKPQLDIPILQISEAETIIKYDTTNNDLISRQISVKIAYTLSGVNGKPKSYEFEVSKNDSITYEDLRFTESEGFSGKIPPRKESFYDQVVEPLIFIASSALAVILFFTIRSK